jgi:hypothetical protein
MSVCLYCTAVYVTVNYCYNNNNNNTVPRKLILMSKSRCVQHYLFWIAARKCSFRRKCCVMECIHFHLCKCAFNFHQYRVKYSFFFFSPMEWQVRLDTSGILQTAFKSYLRAAWFPFPVGCGGGEGCFIPVKSIQLRFYCMKLYNKKSFLILFWDMQQMVITYYYQGA